MARKGQQTGNLAKIKQPHGEPAQPTKISQPLEDTPKLPRGCDQQRSNKLPRSMLRGILNKTALVVGWAGVALTLSGVALTLLSALFFLPRISVDSPGPYDPLNPTPISFVISNTNIIALRDVQPIVGLCFLKFAALDGTEQKCNGPALSRLAFGPWHSQWLSPDEKYQIFIEDMVKVAKIPEDGRVDLNANITIGVDFSPWYAPWRNTKEFRFATRKLSDGKTYWIPTPVNK